MADGSGGGAAGATVDTRAQARERKRRMVVDAMLARFEAGDADPTPGAIAAQAGVSERSVFRYFSGLDDLRRAVLRRAVERSADFLGGPSAPEETLSARIEELVDLRLALWTATGGATRVAFARAVSVPEIAAEIDHVRTALHAQVGRFFAPELGALPPATREGRHLAIDALTAFGAFDLMTTTHRCSSQTVRLVWVSSLGALLATD